MHDTRRMQEIEAAEEVVEQCNRVLLRKLNLVFSKQLLQCHRDVVHDQEYCVKILVDVVDGHDDIQQLDCEEVVLHGCKLTQNVDFS